jgi:ribose transport system permease protein
VNAAHPTAQTDPTPPAGTASPRTRDDELESTPRQSRRHLLGFSNISAVYVGIALFILFSLWVPHTFLRSSTFTTIVDEQAITGIIAVALVLPFAAGAFDLSFAYNLGFGSIVAAWLVGNHGFPWWATILVTLCVCAAIGGINGGLVTLIGINPVIATLGVGSCLSAGTTWISGGQQIIGLSSSFTAIANDSLLGVSLPVYYLAGIASLIWYVLAHTPWGRHIYAVGGNREAARLAGVRTDWIVFVSLAMVGLAAGFAGVLASAQIGAGDPSIGPPYLLPALAAVFLGSTQFQAGRFNVWGTLIAVFVLAIGVKGLELAGAPFWLPDMFNGLALLIAVGISQRDFVAERLARLRRLKGPPATRHS